MKLLCLGFSAPDSGVAKLFALAIAKISERLHVRRFADGGFARNGYWC
ncbi:hypothetical protein H6F74_22715 [Trichocoleus sp. FACHB-90]|nr:hypothetical protein [Trichocoleus sp. FACHB-90]MBD1929036.1 hypothetical protein [Trichocoleus sp. FACHB-90]